MFLSDQIRDCTAGRSHLLSYIGMVPSCELRLLGCESRYGIAPVAEIEEIVEAAHLTSSEGFKSDRGKLQPIANCE